MPLRDLVDALKATFPDSPYNVTFAPEADIVRLFGCAQPIDFTDGLNAGFEPDADLAALTRAALNYRDLS